MSYYPYFRRRIVHTIPAILGIITINFIIIHLAPGDVADVLAGQAGSATPEYIEQIRVDLGLDQPLYIQYVKFIWQMLHFDLGISHRFNMPVGELILSRLPVTATLMLSSMAIAIILGVILGVVAARYVDMPIDWIISLIGLAAYSVPTFWLAQMLILVFAIQLGWLPTGSFETLGADLTGFGYLQDVAWHMVLPISALAAFYLAIYARLMRASMLDVYQLDFVRTAQAKGLSKNVVTFRHVLRNALLPIVTMGGLQFGALLGGAVIIEQVFSLPGIGGLAFDAVGQRDSNLLLSILLLSSILVIVANFITDFLYVLIDPRIELR